MLLIIRLVPARPSSETLQVAADRFRVGNIENLQRPENHQVGFGSALVRPGTIAENAAA
jgi:hypothetical protein